MLPTITEGRRHDAVASDRYDALDHAHAVANIDRLAEAEGKLAAVHEAAADIGQDLFSLFFKPAPRLRDDDELRADRRVNRAVAGATQDTEGCRTLREYTVGDRTTAGLAVTTVVDTVTDLYRKLGPEIDEKAAAAQEAEDEVARLIDRLEAAGDGAEAADLTEQLNEAEAKAEAAHGELGEAIDGMEAAIGRAVRKGTKQAAAQAEEEVETFGTWGTDKAAMARMDPRQRLALASKLNSARLRKIAELFGRLRNLSWAMRKSQWDTLPEEVHDTFVGCTDPTWILPAELMLLGDEDTEDLFWARFVQGEVVGYRLRGRVKAAAGGIICCKDGSGSMVGDRDTYASGVGLALLDIAHTEKRAFHGIQFGGAGQFEQVSFPAPADFTTEKMIEWAELAASWDNGTDFETPLTEAWGILDAEHQATGKVSGDIVFITDGECAVTDEWLAWFKGEQERLGFRVFGVAIATTTRTLDTICDGRILSVRDVHSGRDIEDLFRALTA